ncbi:MAG TPA: replication factor C small subunit [Nitrososphaeraceae archaeon]|jgi:replication factor C small subunit|nr:replication factor C small subunit [Nitrososphaeraceae archaeon]
MWVEKYRPSTLGQMVNQRDVIRGLQNLIKKPNELPHLIFAGPAGVGKTTAALCIAQELLGENWRRDTLELNASDERGIKMVRERVKEFAAVMKFSSADSNDKPYRIIILDEADEMTSEAQTALRRIIEESSRTTRFIIICNYLSQLIEPIQSRCVIFRFTRLPREEVVGHLSDICRQEGIEFDVKALSRIYDSTSGDLRHSINILQSAAINNKITSEKVELSIGLSGRAKAGEVIKLALAGKFNEARVMLLELTQVFGMSEKDFLKYAAQEAFSMKLSDPGKFAELMAEYDYRLSIGAHPDIQLTAFLAQVSMLSKK